MTPLRIGRFCGLGLLAAVWIATGAQAAVVAGRLVDESDRPVAGAEVTWISWIPGFNEMELRLAPPEQRPQARTGPDGSFRLPGVAAGRGFLQIRHPAFVTVEAMASEAAEARANLGTLILERGAAFRGRVVDPQGRPNPGVPVSGRIADALVATGERAPVVLSGPDGSFVVTGFRPAQDVWLRVGYPETALTTVEGPAGNDEPGTATLPVIRSSLSGRVLTPDGAPLAGADVRADRRLTSEEGSLAGNQTITDAAGRFAFQHLPGGIYLLTAGLRSVGRGELRDVAVGEAEDVGGLEVRVRPAERFAAPRIDQDRHADAAEPAETIAPRSGATLTGRITGLRAAEHPRVRVEAQLMSADRGVAGWRRGTIDGRGGFRFEHLAPGTWGVSAGLDGRWGTATVTIPSGQTAATAAIEIAATTPTVVCTPPAAER